MLLLSHPTGNENVRQAARALNEVGLLSEFWTCVYWNQKHALNKVLPSSVARELNRRTFSHLRQNQL
ncbi:MAG: hypothetical protein M3Y84_03780, partial [Acidobacteriota bacterium]|nr:hypothetical protein [Acidobacteriota bacterium]